MRERNRHDHAGVEPSIEELVSDPVIGALMRADRVHAWDIFVMVDRFQAMRKDERPG